MRSVQGAGALTYASRVAGKQANGRKKLNVLDIMLEKNTNRSNFNMSKEELSRLLFKKMKIDPKNVLKVDTSGFGKIFVELTDNINPENFGNLPAFDINEGLRVKYYKPHHRKESLITINWLDLETPDELLIHVFNHFGNVKSNVKWSKIKQEEGDSDMAKPLNNIMSGERQFWMEITKPLPSYAVIDRRKVKIHHAGQRRTCARCQKTADLCKGNSNARLCEDNGGEKTNVVDVWKNILAMVNYVEWKDEEPVAVDDPEIDGDDLNEVEDNGAANVTNCDGFVISNLDEETTVEDIKTILKGTATEEAIAGLTVHPTGSTRSKIIKDIDPALVNIITKKIDSKSYKGRLLHCRPHVPVSPSKKENNKEEPATADFDKKDVVNKQGPPNTIEPTNEKEKKDNEDEDTSKSAIPGLTQKDLDKAKKKKEKLEKAAKKKEEKQKEMEKKENGKKHKDLKQHDFLLNSTTKDENTADFVFSGVSVSEEEEGVFEDSVEEIPKENIEAFLTPKPFKSLYAKQVEATPGAATSSSVGIKSKRPCSVAGLSPIDKVETTKKAKPTAVRSSLPRLC